MEEKGEKIDEIELEKEQEKRDEESEEPEEQEEKTEKTEEEKKGKSKKKTWVWIFIILVLVFGFFVLKNKNLTGEVVREDAGEVDQELEEDQVIDDVKERQIAVVEARELYAQKRNEGMVFSSQCLGIVGYKIKFAVDIVHVPRTEEDDLPENQCEEYREGKVRAFIELDKDGNIFRIS